MSKHLPPFTVDGEDLARLLFVARDMYDVNYEDPNSHDNFKLAIADAFLAAVRHHLALPTLSGWIDEDNLKKLEEAGVYPFWDPPDRNE